MLVLPLPFREAPFAQAPPWKSRPVSSRALAQDGKGRGFETSSAPGRGLAGGRTRSWWLLGPIQELKLSHHDMALFFKINVVSGSW